MPTHRTLAGDELTYPAPSEDEAAFLARVMEATEDPEVGADDLADLIYSQGNPLLKATLATVPERGVADSETWARPLWHVMLDLLESKRVYLAENTPTLRLHEAAALLDLTEDAVRKAAIAGSLDGEKRANRWHVTPASVATYRDRVLRRGRWPATPLRVRCGSEDGFSVAVKYSGDGEKKFVRRRVVDITLGEWERVAVRLRWKDGEGKKARRLLILEHAPDTAPSRFGWPPKKGSHRFFIEGRFRIIDKVNNAGDASVAWREFEPS